MRPKPLLSPITWLLVALVTNSVAAGFTAAMAVASWFRGNYGVVAVGISLSVLNAALGVGSWRGIADLLGRHEGWEART